MIATIIRREFLDNLLSFKFVACVLVAVMVSLASTSILTSDYQGRLKNYDVGVASARETLTKVPVYSCLKFRMFWKPTPLSIFIAGIERKAGSYAEFGTLQIDIPASLQGGTTKNEFAASFSIFDFSAVIIIIFSVLAILLSYGSISGEKEEGVLSLALANSVPRHKILLGKYLGALVSISVPLAMCFILGILYLLFSKNIEIDRDFFVSMGILYCVSLLYLSAILILGIFASSCTKTSFASLLALLTFYLGFTFLIPQAVKSYATNAIMSRAKNVENNIQALQEERRKKGGEAFKNVGFKETWMIPRDADNMMAYGGIILRRITSPEFIENQSMITVIQSRLEREYAQKVYDLKSQDMAVEERIQRAQNTWLAFVPSTNFARVAELVMDTGDESSRRFLRQVNLYWHQTMAYLDRKNAFGMRYFYPGPDALTLYEKDLIMKITNDRVGQVKDPSGSSYLLRYNTGKYYGEAMKYSPPLTFLNLDDLPAFRPGHVGLAARLKTALFNVGILIFYNIIFFALAYVTFARYDPRRTG